MSEMIDPIEARYGKNEVPKLIFDWREEVDGFREPEIMAAACAGVAETVGISDMIVHAGQLSPAIGLLAAFKNESLRKVIRVDHRMLVKEPASVFYGASVCADFSSLGTHVGSDEMASEISGCVSSVRSAGSDVATAVIPVGPGNFDRAATLAADTNERENIAVVLEPTLGKTRPGIESLTWHQLDQLYRNVVDMIRARGDIAVFFRQGILPTRLLTQHPCNAYVCKGHTCHSGKRDISRKLVVLPSGEVLPESSEVDARLSLGNLIDLPLNQLLNAYYESSRHQEFRQIVKDVFLEYVQNCPFRVVPWTELFIEASMARAGLLEANGERVYA